MADISKITYGHEVLYTSRLPSVVDFFTYP